METRISRDSKEVVISNTRPTVLIGERINPSGKKKLTESLLAGNLDIVKSEAIAQLEAGADIIDVNVGAFGIDEVTMLPQAVKAVMDVVDIPLCIDSAKPEALAAALKVYKGKPLINSVSGEERSLKAVLPLVKEYGAAVVGLLQDDEGIPKNIERRLMIASRIIDRATAIGIPPEDIVIDCLTIAVGAEPNAGPTVIETIRGVCSEWGVNLTLGASNVSFGLPDRNLLNHAFVAIAIASGVTSLIVDVAKVRPAILAADLLMAKDKRARRYIEAFRSKGNLK